MEGTHTTSEIVGMPRISPSQNAPSVPLIHNPKVLLGPGFLAGLYQSFETSPKPTNIFSGSRTRGSSLDSRRLAKRATRHLSKYVPLVTQRRYRDLKALPMIVRGDFCETTMYGPGLEMTTGTLASGIVSSKILQSISGLEQEQLTVAPELQRD